MKQKKKYSIKTTFTLIFVAIIAALMLGLYLLNRFALQGYYESVKIRNIEIAYTTLDKAVEVAENNGTTIFDVFSDESGKTSDDSPTSNIFRTLNERSNIDIVIASEDWSQIASMSREAQWLVMKLDIYRKLYGDEDFISDSDIVPSSSDTQNEAESEAAAETEASADDPDDNEDAESSEDGKGFGFQLPSLGNQQPKDIEIPQFLKDTQQMKVLRATDHYMIQSVHDYRSDARYMECWGTFSDGKTYFFMSMPLASIREGVAITTRFMFLCGLMLLVIGIGVVYFAAGRLTKPINELAKLSDAMSNLDFSRKYEGKDRNEIGVLGNSMNSMSEKLEQSISELKEANARLQTDIDEKIRIDDIRKEFIANVSHELKTPIALISGYAEGLTEGLAEDPESRDYYCGVILDESVKMNKMVRQLTSLITYEFGGEILDMAEFNLSDLARSVVSSLKMKFDEKEAIVELDLPDQAMVSADEFKIEEVLTNYLNNAMNHLGGEKHIRVTLKENESSVTVSVFNEGEHIPDDSLPRIWEKFYKVDKARTRAYGGSGIGLSIVKAIMDAHGGSYEAENVEGGVEFSFSLKKAVDEQKTL